MNVRAYVDEYSNYIANWIVYIILIWVIFPFSDFSSSFFLSLCFVSHRRRLFHSQIEIDVDDETRNRVVMSVDSTLRAPPGVSSIMHWLNRQIFKRVYPFYVFYQWKSINYRHKYGSIFRWISSLISNLKSVWWARGRAVMAQKSQKVRSVTSFVSGFSMQHQIHPFAHGSIMHRAFWCRCVVALQYPLDIVQRSLVALPTT